VPLRVAFAGTPEFAAVALRRLVKARFKVVLVLTQPDRPAGRGLKTQPSPVKQLALEQALPLAQPRSLRLDGRFADDAAQARAALDAAQPDVLVVAAYGLILPRWVLERPRLGCLNIHASLLPRQRSIEAGDRETGITIMQMDEGLDTGATLLAERMPITADDSAATLHDKLAALGGRLIVEALEAAACGGLAARPQPTEGVTYARKLDKAEARIDWQRPAAEIERRVRAFDPAPGCWFEFEGQPLKVWRGRVSEGFGAAPGSLRWDRDGARVACGDGRALTLLEVQRPGGRRQSASSWAATRR
jgi:methionyl-tRNA formyltransferase